MRRLAGALGVAPAELLDDPVADSPVPAALEEFLRSPEGRTATDAEVAELHRLQARGARPTVDTYYWALKMIRSMETDT